MDYNRAINAAICGHILTLLAIILNVMAASTLGIVLGVLTYAVSYFAESLNAQGFRWCYVRPLYAASIPLCFFSYLFWLLSF